MIDPKILDCLCEGMPEEKEKTKILLQNQANELIKEANATNKKTKHLTIEERDNLKDILDNLNNVGKDNE